MASEAHQPSLQLFDPPKKIEQPTSESEALDSSQENAESDPDQHWKELSFPSFLQTCDIAGLGQKKLDAISDSVSTFGDFEELRTKASVAHCHLAELLPQGFGTKITDQIEELYLNEVTKLNNAVAGLVELPASENESDEDDEYQFEDATDYEDVDLDSL